jgi:hypothetical protein
MLVDITDVRQIEFFREQAARCLRLARSVTDGRTMECLTRLGQEYEKTADELAGRMLVPKDLQKHEPDLLPTSA